MNVYDLSNNASTQAQHNLAAAAMMHAGFNLTNKDGRGAELAMISRGNVSGAMLDFGAVFIDPESELPTVHVFTALPGDTPQSTLQSLEDNFDHFLSKDPDSGMYVGYIAIKPAKDEYAPKGDAEHPGLKDIDKNPYISEIEKLRDLKIKTAPIPFTQDGLGLLPIFNTREGMVFDIHANQQSKVAATMRLSECFNGQLSVVDLPHDLLEMAIERNNPNTLKQQDDMSRSATSPKPSFR